MQAASLLDGFSFDLFPPFENDLAASEVDVSRRQVVQALVVSTVVVVADELLDALFGDTVRADAGYKWERASSFRQAQHVTQSAQWCGGTRGRQGHLRYLSGRGDV